MDRELIDRVWKILPAEFKEEVKKLYAKLYNEKPQSDCSYGYLGLLIKLFGYHNLTSDAEGEELLTVSRKRVQDAYLNCDRYFCYEGMLEDLFGSKCLPDELNEDNFAKSEPKSAEPFKVSDMVIYKPTGKKKVVFGTDKYGRYIVALPNMQSPMYVDESDLEPYTEPTEPCTNDCPSYEVDAQTVNSTCTDDCQSQCKSQDHFPYPAKMVIQPKSDGPEFIMLPRLKIAAMAMQGIMANPSQQCVEMDVAAIANLSLLMADALLHEAEKGGKSNERV